MFRLVGLSMNEYDNQTKKTIDILWAWQCNNFATTDHQLLYASQLLTDYQQLIALCGLDAFSYFNTLHHIGREGVKFARSRCDSDQLPHRMISPHRTLKPPHWML